MQSKPATIMELAGFDPSVDRTDQQFVFPCRPVTGFGPHSPGPGCWCHPEWVEVRNATSQAELERAIDRARMLH